VCSLNGRGSSIRKPASETQGKHNFGSAAPSLAEKPLKKEGTVLLKDGDRKAVVRVADKGHRHGLGLTGLAGELFSGRFRPGQCLQLDRIAVELGMDNESVLKACGEFQAIGMITFAEDFSAIVNSPDPKGMRDAYNVRAALEEIGGRAAATALEGNVVEQLEELSGMRAAVYDGNVDACVEHDINFHRSILGASQNDFLLRVWDSLSLDLRMRTMTGNLREHMREVVESHQPIVDAPYRKDEGDKPVSFCGITWKRSRST
jgi:DNA-binding GntR family transcriptional regulator